ncbi:MAG: alpha/beta hydrolase [Bacteroidales bacterium]|nr:alpha/beta hydrolase [Bacteroidales bacterium]
MKKTTSTLLILLLMSLSGYTQQEVINEKKIYKKVMGIDLHADMFYTEEVMKRQNNPAIAFFHGGGWVSGSPSEFYNAARRYAQKSFVTFSFQYRLSRTEDGSMPHPEITPVECTKDARSALRWLKEHADELHIDPDRIVASGQSAGGQLAIATAIMDDINEASDNLETDPTPVALLLFSSNLNTVEPWLDYLMGERRSEIWSISPYHNLKAGMPPAIEFHGTKDPQVPYYIVEFYMQKTRQLGNHFEQVRFEGTGHYLAEGNEKYATYFDEDILEKADAFLRKLGVMKK